MPSGNVNSMPRSNRTPDRSRSVVPTFCTSMNSKSSALKGLPAGGGAGWYITSVTRSGTVSTANGASVIALQTVPWSTRARTVTCELICTGPA